MPHYATLRDYRFKDQIDDIRGCDIYGVNDDKLGTIDDVVFEHGSGDVKYVVVNTGGWLSSKKFLVPADRIHSYDKDRNAMQVDLVKEHIERYFPPYDEKIHERDEDWHDYEGRYNRSATENKAWDRDEERRGRSRTDLDQGPVLHKEGSNRILTPEPEEMPAASGSSEGDLAGRDTTPQRMTGKFTETFPGGGKIQMTPAGTEDMPRSVKVGNEATPSRDTQDFSQFTGKGVTTSHTPRTLDDGGPQDTSGWAEHTKPQERDRDSQSDKQMHHRHEGDVESIDTSPDFRPATVKSPAPLGSLGEEVPSDLRDTDDVPGRVEVSGRDDRRFERSSGSMGAQSGPETLTSDNRAMNAQRDVLSASDVRDRSGLGKGEMDNVDLHASHTHSRDAMTTSDRMDEDHRLRDRNMNVASHPIEDVRGTGRVGVSQDDMHSRPERWRRFEDLLRKNRVDIEAKCPQCAPARERKDVA